MSVRSHARLLVIGAVRPGRAWRLARFLAQSLAIVAIIVAPFLGGWQRLDKNHMGAWNGEGWDLPPLLFENLPLGSAPARAYDFNRLLGGGVAVDYLGIPAIDPLAGLVALGAGEISTFLVVAWLLPVALSLLLGRIFCGWFCPFGVLARALERLLRHLPFRAHRYRLPRRRWFRYVLLGALLFASGLGFHMALYAFLPHLVVQQSVYSMWLMGGGGVVTGWLIALIAVGLWFGPTSYCAMLCPTGTALGLLGRRRLARVTIAEPSRCGAHCALCTNACWLGLDPASGDPGPDCDSCARCFPVCPNTNLRVGFAMGRPTLTALTLALVSWPMLAQADFSDREKPRLLMDERRSSSRGVIVSLAVVDLSGVRLDADDERTEEELEISVVIFRGESPAANELGRRPLREVYDGPLELQIEPKGQAPTSFSFTAPTEPYSTPTRTVYRQRFHGALSPGDRVSIAAIADWNEEPVRFLLPEKNPGRRMRGLLEGLVHGVLLFGGLLSIALIDHRRNCVIAHSESSRAPSVATPREVS